MLLPAWISSEAFFAPASQITLLGNFGNTAIQSQWVGKNVDMTGSLIATFQYNSAVTYQFPALSTLELTK
jgi:hypothetical protein